MRTLLTALLLCPTVASAQLIPPDNYALAGLINNAMGVIDIHLLPQPVTQAKCIEMGAPNIPNAIINGCTFLVAQKWQVYINADLDPMTKLQVTLHEFAHTAGWKHPVPRPTTP